MNRNLLIVIAAIFAIGAGAGIGVAKLRKPAEPVTVREVVEKPGKPVELEEFLVNLSDTAQPHYLKAQMVLVVKDIPEAPKQVEEKTPQVRDAMILAMSQCSFRELLTPQGKATLKKAIRKQVNRVLKSDLVTDVYFTSFAMQ